MKLGKNRGAYHGETIDITSVLGDIVMAARGRGWMLEELAVAPEMTLPALRLGSASTRPAAPGVPETVPGTGRPALVYLSAGIHGDEPAGPLAVRQLLLEHDWPTGLELWVCPCLNPSGFLQNRRENAAGVDLNRDYRHQTTPEVRAHVAWLERQPRFDLSICLHEDWEAHGFYLYELRPADLPSPASAVIAEVAAICPIDPSPRIDGWEARGGVIRPAVDPANRPHWPEALHLIQHKTRHSVTLEAPSDFPLRIRTAALACAVRALLNWCRNQGV